MKLALALVALAVSLPTAAAAKPKKARASKARVVASAPKAAAPAATVPAPPDPAPEPAPVVALAAPTAADTAAQVDAAAAADPWKLDLDVGLPAFGAGESNLAFDVAGGYAGPNVGFDARFAMSSYSLASGDSASATQRSTLQANGRYLTGAPGGERWEARGELEKVDYAGISVDSGGGGGSATSLFRLVALGGFHSRRDVEMPWRLAAGVGLQNESSVNVSSDGGSGAASWGTRFLVRGAIERRVMPETLKLRGEAEVATVSVSKLEVGPSSSVSDVFGVESAFRLHGDLERFAFFGFVPAPFVGVDVVALDAGTAVVPLFGVGVIR